MEPNTIVEEIPEVKVLSSSESQRIAIRGTILNMEEAIRRIPGSLVADTPEYFELCPLKESFGDGCYIRELFLPKNHILTSKIHKKTHPYFIMKGEVSVLTENGVQKIKAPFSGITPAGTKRVIYTHEDTVWMTVHVTNKTDSKEIEDEIIAKSYAEIGLLVDEEAENIKLLDFVETIKKENKKDDTLTLQAKE